MRKNNELSIKKQELVWNDEPFEAGSKRSCAGYDLNELAGDDGLAGPVERQRQLVDHLTWRMSKEYHTTTS
jgi:hypothetical protein